MRISKVSTGEVSSEALHRHLKEGRNMVSHKEISSMLTVSDVARLLNVHINTVRRWSNQGRLKAYRIGSRGDRRFQREDVAMFLWSEGKDSEVELERNLT